MRGMQVEGLVMPVRLYVARALQQHKGVKGAASQLWTLDLLTVLESTLRHPLPHDHACNSPPAPATPPQGGGHGLMSSRHCLCCQEGWLRPSNCASRGGRGVCRGQLF